MVDRLPRQHGDSGGYSITRGQNGGQASETTW